LKKFPYYKALMNNILDSEPSSFQEATNQQVWCDAMVGEYTHDQYSEEGDNFIFRVGGLHVV
jgi:hypothetical protein